MQLALGDFRRQGEAPRLFLGLDRLRLVQSDSLMIPDPPAVSKDAGRTPKRFSSVPSRLRARSLRHGASHFIACRLHINSHSIRCFRVVVEYTAHEHDMANAFVSNR
jgi:hypothetical protein